jgi:hypothetical protein
MVPDLVPALGSREPQPHDLRGLAQRAPRGRRGLGGPLPRALLAGGDGLCQIALPAAAGVVERDTYDRRKRPLVCPCGRELSVSQSYSITRGAFAGFVGRVFIGIGGLSHPMWQAQATALATAFPVSRLEIFEERHHLDPPQNSETHRLVADLLWAWRLDTAA